MKRLICLTLTLVCLLFFSSCKAPDSISDSSSADLNSSDTKSSAIVAKSFSAEDFKLSNDTDIELLRVVDGKAFVNELDTLSDPFLFVTKALHILSADGDAETISINSDKRIVDFIRIDGVIYYFTLITENGEYYSELCKFEDKNAESVLNKYRLDDPYAYPRFVKADDSYCYEINNDIYWLFDNAPFIECDEDIFLSKATAQRDLVSYKSATENGYTLHGGEGLPTLSLNFGNFTATEKGVIYQSLENNCLYIADGSENNKALYDETAVLDFNLADKDTLFFATDSNIFLYDLNDDKIVAKYEKPKDAILWTFSDLNGTVCMYSNMNVYFFK